MLLSLMALVLVIGAEAVGEKAENPCKSQKALW